MYLEHPFFLFLCFWKYSHSIYFSNFSYGPGDRGSILINTKDSNISRVKQKTQKKVLDSTFLNIEHYKVWIKGIVEQSREWSSALSYTSV